MDSCKSFTLKIFFYIYDVYFLGCYLGMQKLREIFFQEYLSEEVTERSHIWDARSIMSRSSGYMQGYSPDGYGDLFPCDGISMSIEHSHFTFSTFSVCLMFLSNYFFLWTKFLYAHCNSPLLYIYIYISLMLVFIVFADIPSVQSVYN